LAAGVDINTVRAWLGHLSIETTNVYAEITLEGKAQALAKCEISVGQASSKHWHNKPNIMQVLSSL
jgi:hypothetical protein